MVGIITIVIIVAAAVSDQSCKGVLSTGVLSCSDFITDLVVFKSQQSSASVKLSSHSKSQTQMQ